MSGITGTLTPEHFNNFGELLRYLRERAELSQRELALQVGYHYSYMSRIEKNERMPDSATLMARFIPALRLDDEPHWTERLLKLAEQDPKSAVRLCALADTHREKHGFTFLEPDAITLEDVLKQSRKKLGKAAYEAAYDEGLALKLESTLVRLMAD